MLNELGQFVQTQMPSRFMDDHPRFVRLMELYYQWLYRKSGMTDVEINDVIDNFESWTNVDMDKFLATESPRFNSFQGSDHVALSDITQWRPPGAMVERFHSQYLLEREYDAFMTSDGDYFTDDNDTALETSYVMEQVIDTWADKFNHTRFKDSTSLNPHDEILLLKSLKMLYAIKGSEKCIKLFFKVYFNEDVSVYIPKFDIAIIDGDPILDSKKYLRDDRRFQEYCYVIQTENDPEPYRAIFNDVYMNNFHPGGFNVYLEQKEQD